MSEEKTELASTNDNSEPINKKLNYESVMRFLKFHKAIIRDDGTDEKLNYYIELVEQLDKGMHLGITDPFERAIALLFELAVEQEVDPWDIDLVQFSADYIQRVRAQDLLDLITAGQLIYMAWHILKLQSAGAVERAQRSGSESSDDADGEVTDDMLEGPAGDWYVDDTAYDYTTAVLRRAKPPIEEMVWRKGKRRVSLLELAQAFEAAKKDVELHRAIAEKRKALRAQYKLQRDMIGTKVRKEELIEDIRTTWARISKYDGYPIPFSNLHERSRDNFIRTLRSILFLADYRDKKIDIWQDDFPYGEIYIKRTKTKSELEGTTERFVIKGVAG
jgi:segregation and condensation protein A